MSEYGGYKMIEHLGVLQLVLDTPMQLVLFHGQSKSCDSSLTMFSPIFHVRNSDLRVVQKLITSLSHQTILDLFSS